MSEKQPANKATRGWVVYTKWVYRPDLPWHWLVWDECQIEPEAIWQAHLAQQSKGNEFEVKIMQEGIFV